MSSERLSRRDVLGLALGSTCAMGLAWCARRAPIASSNAPISPRVVAEALARASESEALDLTERWLRAGQAPEHLLVAAYLARPLMRTDQGDLHSMLVIPAIARLASPFATPETLSTVFWALQQTATWMLSPESPESPPEPPPGLEPRLVTRSLALRDPHLAILTSRSIALAGGRAASHRALLLHRLDRALGSPPPSARQPALRPVAHSRGAAVEDALAALVWASEAEIRPLLAELLTTRISLTDLWTALVIEAAERIQLDPAPSGLGVHALTMTEARFGLARAYPALSLQIALSTAQRLTAMRPGGALRQDAPAASSAVLADLRTAALAHGSESHAFKHPDALIRLAEWVAPPWRQRFLAAAAIAPVFTAKASWPWREEGLTRSRRVLASR